MCPSMLFTDAPRGRLARQLLSRVLPSRRVPKASTRRATMENIGANGVNLALTAPVS